MSRPQHQPNAAPSSVPEASAASSNDETISAAHSPGGDVEMPRFASATNAGELGRLGKYRILKELGRGGMGAVYLAFDERLQRKVALKVMLPKAAANTSAKERFLREARAAAQISNDHVVNIYEADEIDGIPYIALQYLQGYPLDEYLAKQGNPSLPQIIRIGQETALGLEAAHQLGLVHRDIKPGNLWLEAPNGRVKILDFGLARQQDDNVHLTRSGAVVGTPAYMSPEQGRGLAVDGRSDLFSLGGVLYRLCTGRLPFKGDTTMALLMAIGIDEPTPVRQLNPSVPEPLANLIHRLLAKDPAHRPPSGQAVADELNAIFSWSQGHAAQSNQLPVVYLPMAITAQESNPFEGITEFGSATGETAVGLPADSAPDGEQPRRFMPLVGSLLFTLLIVAGAVFLIANNNKKPDPDVAAKVPDTTPLPKNNPTKGKDSLFAKDADRIAAAYALSVGGVVRINEEVREIKNAADLPKETFRLTNVMLRQNKQVDDTGLLAFKGCKHLTYLDLHHTQVTDKGLANFQDSQDLLYLSLGETQVGDAGLANFKECKNLMTIYAAETKISNVGLANFKECKNLTNLHLPDTQVGDAGMVHFKGCKNLHHLNLSRTQVGDVGLANFANCKNLTLLDLGNTQVTDAGLVHFKDCADLEGVYLPNTAVSDAGPACFKNSKGLKELRLDNTQVGDAGMKDLLDKTKLVSLTLQKTKVTPAGLDLLRKALPLCKIEYDGGVIEPKK